MKTAGVRMLRAACALILLILIAGLCAALIPQAFGFRPAVVTSGSMGRSIPVGSLAITRAVDAGGIHEGDVILVREAGARPKLHRVVGVEHDNGKTLVTTRGDANAAPDPNQYVLPPRVDVLAYSMPLLGYLVGFMLTPAGWVLAVGLPGALVCAFVLRGIWSEDHAPTSIERGETPRPRRPVADLLAEIDRRRLMRTPPVVVRLPRSLISRVRRPSPAMLAVVIVAVTASAAAVAGYLLAPRSSTSGGQERLAHEAASLTQLSANMAARDGYAADLLLLRDAADPALGATGRPEQEAALKRLLGDPSNVFDSLAIVDSSGQVVASTDPRIAGVQAGAAVRLARANGSVASSIEAPTDRSAGTIDFAASLPSPNGTPAGLLLARATAERLWAPALAATVDGSRNVIVDADGSLIAGAPADELGRAWNAAPAGLGTLHATVGGTPSVCASGAIGEGTHLDMGWRVASCLPDSLAATTGATPARRDATIIVVAAALAASLVASVVVFAAARRPRDRSARRDEPPRLDSIEARLSAIEARLHERGA